MPPPHPPISTLSLGMFILDDIHIPHRPHPLTNVLGGSAAFVVLGERLFLDPKTVGCLVIAGNDFPAGVRKEIESWGTSTVVRERRQPSSRGRLVYEDEGFGAKSFTYTHPPLKPSPTDLPGTSLLHAKILHLFGPPEEILILVPELLRLRHEAGTPERPLFVWEPLPSSCVELNYAKVGEACKIVDVFSPNHLELGALCGGRKSDVFERGDVERWMRGLVTSGVGMEGKGVVVTRAGEYGAVGMSRVESPVWLPPFYELGSGQVVDATGAGNTFLGGYIAGWEVTGGKLREAMCHGSVAASFALEQVGLPVVGREGGKVLCNGVDVDERLREYLRCVG